MPDDSEPDIDPDDAASGGGTTTSEYRWKFLSTVVVVTIIVTYSLMVLGMMYGPTIGLTVQPPTPGTWATYTVGFLAALMYSVGVDTVRNAAKAREQLKK